MVHIVKSLSEYNDTIKSDKLVVVDYFATWCGPCVHIAPEFEALSRKYSDVIFVKVDVDESADIAGQEKIRAMPTFRFFKNGKFVDELVGASAKDLEAKIEKNK